MVSRGAAGWRAARNVQGWKASVTDLVMFATGASDAMERRMVRGSIRDYFAVATVSAHTTVVEIPSQTATVEMGTARTGSALQVCCEDNVRPLMASLRLLKPLPAMAAAKADRGWCS